MSDSDDDDFSMDSEFLRMMDAAAAAAGGSSSSSDEEEEDDNIDADNPGGDIATANETQQRPVLETQTDLRVSMTMATSYDEDDTSQDSPDAAGVKALSHSKQKGDDAKDPSHFSSSYFSKGQERRNRMLVETVHSSIDSSVESDTFLSNHSTFNTASTGDKPATLIHLEQSMTCDDSIATTAGSGSNGSSVDSSSSTSDGDNSDSSRSDSNGSNTSKPSSVRKKNASTLDLGACKDQSKRTLVHEYPNTVELAKKTAPNPYVKTTTANTGVTDHAHQHAAKSEFVTASRRYLMAEDSDSDDGSSLSSDDMQLDEVAKTVPKPQDEVGQTNVDITSIPTEEDSTTSGAMPAPELRPKVTETSSLEVHEYNPQSNEPGPEIDPAFYVPPTRRQRIQPILKEFNIQRHPLHVRGNVKVTSLFAPPMDKLWTGKFQEFNHFQSEMVKWMYDTDDNVVVSAPTGAGKSTIFEIAMAKFFTMDLLAQDATMSSHQTHALSKARKIVYIAPSKALCEERYDDWSRRLQDLQLGIKVAMITGDSADPGLSFGDLASAHLVISTPEKWDSMTRRWQENFYLMASVKLLLVDEVHLLGESDRGWCLETIVCRMKTIHRAAQAVEVDSAELNRSSYPATNPDAIKTPFRMVAVSATLPNIAEVAEFFHANEAYSFDDSYRPIPLAKHVLAMGNRGKNEWKFWNSLSQHVPDVIKRFSNGKQSLIFCHTKKETEKIAEMLIQRRAFGRRNAQSSAKVGSVQYFLDHGIGYHHAGLEKEDRRTIEHAFAEGRIKCLACTSTLATGVNLPAHLVLVVGSRTWRGNGKGYEEIETSQLLQMIGRAGRPGLDSSGTAVIITDNDSRSALQRQLNSGLGAAKSQLLTRLPEVLNSEISSLVIQSVDDCYHWFQGTFLFSCMSFQGHSDVMTAAYNLCREALKRLHEIGLIEMNCDRIEPQAGCHIMNKQLLTVDAMRMITSLPSDATQCQILRSISRVKALQQPVRKNEKKELREIHKTDTVKYKISNALSKFTVQDESQKAFILLQTIISQHEFQNHTLRQEMASLTNNATKILSASQEYCVKASKFGSVARFCFMLQRSLMVCLWGIDSGVLNQIDGVGMTCAKLLRFKGICNFQHVLDSSEKVIEQAAGRKFPFGRELKTTVQHLLRDNLELSAKVEYSRDSKRPVSFLVTLKESAASVGIFGARNGDPTVSHTIIAYTDSRTESILFYGENINKTSSFRVRLPDGIEKIHVTKLASVVGLDDNIVIDTTANHNWNEPSNPLLPSGDRNAAKSRVSTRHFPIAEKRTTRQFDISFTASERQKPNTASAPPDPSPTITPNRDDIRRLNQKVEGTGEQQSGKNRDTPRADLEGIWTGNGPSSCTPSTVMRPRAAEAPFNITPPTYGRDPRIQTRQRNPLDVQVSKHNPPRLDDTAGNRLQSASSFWNQQASDNIESCRNERSSRDVGHQWNKTRQSASKSQQRAFTGKRENPFRSFTHDPNDSEGRLKKLSQHGQPFSSRQFKRKKDMRSDRPAPSGGQRVYLQQIAEELEEHRYQNQFTLFNRRFASPQNIAVNPHLYPPQSIYRATPFSGLPPEAGFRTSQMNPPVQRSPGYNWGPSHDPRYAPSVGHPHEDYDAHSQYRSDFSNTDPFATPYGRYEPPTGDIPLHAAQRNHNDLFQEDFRSQQGHQWDQQSNIGPPSEIEVRAAAPQQYDPFSQPASKNPAFRPTGQYSYSSNFAPVNDAFDSFF